jgi:phosphatidylserine decarboxylase
VGFRKEVYPFIFIVLGIQAVITALGLWAGWDRGLLLGIGTGIALIGVLYLLWFFRDPKRIPPADPAVILSGADGVIAQIKEVREDKHLKTDAIRISIFLNLFNVHVNRAPIAGKVKYLDYFAGQHVFTFLDESSDVNQHSEILIEGPQTRCLLAQIVGPVCRRVVYWLTLDQDLDQGERFGMMKFGSRLDMFFPKEDVEVVCSKGQKVQAGLTVIARLRKQS